MIIDYKIIKIDLMNLKLSDKLCENQNAFDHSPDMDRLFVQAMKEITRFHAENNGFYARLLKLKKFDVDGLITIEQCARIPYIYADFFKTHVLKSVPDEMIVQTFTSSGTTGQKSQMFFDERTWVQANNMIDFAMTTLGFNQSDEEANYIMYTYEVGADSQLGTANTDMRVTKFAKANEIEYALKKNGRGGFDFDVFGVINALKRYEKQGLPVRILGFPSFFYFTLQQMKDLGMQPLKLSPRSASAFGGGWKGYAGKQISKTELYQLGEEMLGIPNHRFSDGFGSVEHSIPYLECKRHHFHVPTWSRVFIHDMKTLEPLPYGEPGFLHFVSPYISSVPAHSVMMGDMAVLYPPEKCGCGINTPYFEILGRAGTSKNKSCAIAASELLKR